MDDLRAAIEPVGPLRVVTVTDGGFGAGVARAARLFGFESVVYVPGHRRRPSAWPAWRGRGPR